MSYWHSMFTKSILSVRQLLPVPFAEDCSQLGTVFELSHSSKMEVLPGRNGLTTEINNLNA